MDVPAEKTQEKTQDRVPVSRRWSDPHPGPLPEGEGVGRARQSRPARGPSKDWNLSSLAGRLTEISDSGAAPTLTAAASLILQAQQRGEPAAWIGFGNSIFFPPDFAEWGIDLEALPVIRAPDDRAASLAADQLLRSGAFGLVVLDLKSRAWMHMAVQSRLAALARKHHAALLCLTRKQQGAPSLGPLVSLHGEGRISRTAFSRFDWEIRILKDKRGAPGWSHTESCRGTDGLC